RYGFAGAVRISLGIEEHGAGRQLVRLRLAPRYSRGVLGLIVALAALALLSLADGAELAALALLVPSAALASRAAHSTARAMGGVLHHAAAALRGDRAVRRKPAKVELARQ